MGGLTFTDCLGWGLRQPSFWLCWLTVLAAFGMAWHRDLRSYAPGILIAAVQLGLLTCAAHGHLMFAMIGDRHCPTLYEGVLVWQPILWTPILLFGIPVLLRTPRELFDRSLRRTAIVTALASMDVLVFGVMGIWLYCNAQGDGHGWRHVLGVW